MFSRHALPTVFLILLGLAVGAVWAGGGWSADVAGDPDEPAHVVTSLMVRDFLAGGHWFRPREFAEQYYADFPKVALGHYPPVFYALAGTVLLLSPSASALIGLQAVLLACFGTLSFLTCRRLAGRPGAWSAAVIVMLMPIVWKIGVLVMADLLLACLCLLAVLIWARYCERPSIRTALLFGLVSALAILTKGSGLMLALLPPVTVLLLGQWRSLRSVSWWCAALPVVLLAGPWMLLTAGITKEGMTGQGVGEFFSAAASFYAKALPRQFGVMWLVLAAAGLVFWLQKTAARRLSALEASLLALLAGGAGIVLLVPAGLSERYLAPMVPVFAILAVAGAEGVTENWTGRRRHWAVVILAAAALAGVVRSPGKVVTGFSTAVAHARESAPADEREVWLASGDPRAEGGIIAHAALSLQSRAPSPVRIYRAGKELARSDWMGRGYRAAFATEAELLNHLDKLGVKWVFVDQSEPESSRTPHEHLLAAALAGAPDRWALSHRQAVVRLPWIKGDLLIYRRVAQNPAQ
jgi:4-amino-4-deoxy-L-arabinose transferase-like glycosyltransferase